MTGPFRTLPSTRIVAVDAAFKAPLAATQHRNALVFQPEWLQVEVKGDGTIDAVWLSGPHLRADGEHYADESWEHFRLDMDRRFEWPPTARDALQWLLDSEPRLRLPGAEIGA